MARWVMLPPELRAMILEIVAEDYRFITEPNARVGYAVVCREWQPVFEKCNFRRLVLEQDRIAGLERFMGKESNRHRRDYLQHLLLRVRLDKYDCKVCQLSEDAGTMLNNNHIFTKAIWDLLTILSKWPGRQQELTLELGAYSPSDSRHTFRDFHLEHNYPHHEVNDLVRHWGSYRLRAHRQRLTRLNDPYHGWINGCQKRVSWGSKQRLTGTVFIDRMGEFPTFVMNFPKVEIVTGLLIRRHFYRKIAVRSLYRLLRDALTCLRWFRHEGWRDVDVPRLASYEKDYTRLISRGLPSSLRELYILEDFNKILHPERSVRHADRNLGITLSYSSRSLENLSVAFLVDAVDFFAEFWWGGQHISNPKPWANLRTLALTSRVLNRHRVTSSRELPELLIAAGRAAAFMPELEIMELWSGGEGHACLFRYSNNAGNPQIAWESCCFCDKMEWDYRVIRCWASLPKHRHSRLATEINRLGPTHDHIKTYATASGFLKLRSHVLDPISDYQLSWEENKWRYRNKRFPVIRLCT